MNTIKRLIKLLVPPILTDALKPSEYQKQTQQIKEYIKQGRIPWTPGYSLYKEKTIAKIITDRDLMFLFEQANQLPKEYGFGLDERCIEYPWLIANFPPKAVNILDAGSALNHKFILEHPFLSNKKIHIITLAPEGNCFWNKGVGYLFEDLRKLPITNCYYDAIVCLSTLEHIGFDNTRYSAIKEDKEDRTSEFILAIKEMHRVLKTGGSLFISVPFGVYQDFEFFQQFDSKLIVKAITAFGDAQFVDKAFYRYNLNGWQLTTEEDCNYCLNDFLQALEQASKMKNKLLDKEKHEINNLAAASQSIVCLHLIK